MFIHSVYKLYLGFVHSEELQSKQRVRAMI